MFFENSTIFVRALRSFAVISLMGPFPYGVGAVRAFHIPRIPAGKRFGPHSPEFWGLAVGVLLSDGHLTKKGDGYLLTLQQGSNNKDYLNAVKALLGDMGYATPGNSKAYLRDNGQRVYYRLNTFTFSSLGGLHALFYEGNVKVVRPGLEPYLTALSLAHWIAGDGYCTTNGGLSLCTDSFTRDECVLLQGMLFRKFGLDCTIQNRTTPGQHRIYVLVNSMPKLRALVLDYLPESMHYKLGVGPKPGELVLFYFFTLLFFITNGAALLRGLRRRLLQEIAASPSYVF